jgi:hypothetical protein
MLMFMFMLMEAVPGREEKLRLTAARTAGRRPNERIGDDRAAKRIILMVLMIFIVNKVSSVSRLLLSLAGN